MIEEEFINQKIKIASLEDIDKLVFLFDAYRVFYKQSSNIDKSRIFLIERIKKQESVIFIAFDIYGNQTGFIQLYPIFSSTRLQRLFQLNDLYVDENSRGNKISVQLIERAKEYCKEVNAAGLMLETAITNEIANRLYHKTGFTKDNTHNYYYWERDDHL